MFQYLRTLVQPSTVSKAKPFKHLPFIKGLDEIRLLKLGKSLQLINVPRNSAPSYFAISYAWGDPTPSQGITVNKQDIKIPASLSHALHRARGYSLELEADGAQGRDNYYVWADGLCINQNDDEEKVSQVLKMNLIYRQAAAVLVYLGEDRWTHESERAIDEISSWADHTTTAIKHPIRFLHQHTHDHKTLDGRFFDRPWWNRVWTLQEVASAPPGKIVVLSGAANFDWSELVKAVSTWLDQEIMYGLGGSMAVDLVTYILLGGLAAKTALSSSEHPDMKHNWLGVLAATASFASTDPRDRIYALATICHSLPGFEVSYSKSVPEVYTDFCKALIRRYSDLEFLQLAGVNHDPLANPHQLPSWVPNFEQLDHPILPYRNLLTTKHVFQHIQSSFKIWNASPYPGRLEPSTSTSPNSLRPKGVQAGTIDTVLPPQSWAESDHGWLRTAYNRFGTTYNTPTLSCHILQAYFRTVLGDYYPHDNFKLTSYPYRFQIAGTFWYMVREKLAPILESMNLSASIGELLLGEVAPEGYLSVELGPHHYTLLRTSLEKFRLLYLFTTSNGYIGYGPECKAGDVVCVIFGCSVPLLLRPTEKGYVILGQCFVLGVMDGELFRGQPQDVDQVENAEVFDIV
ncbi:heterokaryon incompatibility protein-domain-containing protein [Cercophora newfieldiana]|uniref:Heterokaryon incompatibility protein-domain-containing protein n=1 Tax=Cercophora newfieldiana TaxID=92897 RepID=A0AA40CUN0_9PEZI|nr:heterokaryon incompatibility protein-domain-containing protein [Cercophora newfieldiana]